MLLESFFRPQLPNESPDTSCDLPRTRLFAAYPMPFFRRELNPGQQVRLRACALKSLPKTIIMQPCIFHGVVKDGMLYQIMSGHMTKGSPTPLPCQKTATMSLPKPAGLSALSPVTDRVGFNIYYLFMRDVEYAIRA